MEITEKYKRVLLVDDDEDLLEQNKIELMRKGFEVFTANSAEEGWTEFQKIKPDAAVLDLIMEEYDSGFILSYKMKSTEHGKKIPIFILTSATYETGFKFDASTNEEKEWIKADGILAKPVVVEELIAKLESFSPND